MSEMNEERREGPREYTGPERRRDGRMPNQEEVKALTNALMSVSDNLGEFNAFIKTTKLGWRITKLAFVSLINVGTLAGILYAIYRWIRGH